jgi:hypothetical protein
VKTFVASEIAQRIQGPNESPVRVLNRVRNWTKMGLLPPTGEAHPGGGRACVYYEGALLDAMILQELVVDIGLGAIEAAEILKEIKSKAPALFKVPLDKSHRDRTLLALYKHRGSSSVLHVGLLTPDNFKKLFEKHLAGSFRVLDIAVLHDRLEAEPT